MRSAISFLLAAVLPFSGGCLGDSAAPPPRDGGAANVDATTPQAGAGANVPLQGAVFGPLIDDMSMQQSSNGGSWYSYSSRTVPNSEPPIAMTDAGVLNPVEGASFPPSAGSAQVPPLVLEAGTFAFREFSGDAIPKWGAGFGLDLVSALPDGGPVAINACPAGAIFVTAPDAGGVGIPQPFDASPYTGFAFWGISLESGPAERRGPPRRHRHDALGRDLLRRLQELGTCTGTREAGTLDCLAPTISSRRSPFEPGHWKQFAVRWSDPGFHANNWSNEGPLVFDAKHVYNIHFQDTITSASTPPFDIAVADLQWLLNYGGALRSPCGGAAGAHAGGDVDGVDDAHRPDGVRGGVSTGPPRLTAVANASSW